MFILEKSSLSSNPRCVKVKRGADEAVALAMCHSCSRYEGFDKWSPDSDVPARALVGQSAKVPPQRLHDRPTSAPSGSTSARSTWVSAPPFFSRSSSCSCVTLVNDFPQAALSPAFTTPAIVFVLRICSLTLVVVRRDVLFRFLNPALDQLPTVYQLRDYFELPK